MRRNTYSSALAEIAALRRQLVANGLDRARAMTRLLKLVRDEEREATLEKLAETRDKAERTSR